MALALLQRGAAVIPVGAAVPQPELESLAGSLGLAFVADESALAPLKSGTTRSAPRDARLGLLSSGSTGTPKLVWRSAAQVAAAARVYAESVHLSGEDRVMALVPLEHSYGLQNVMLASLGCGASLVFPGTAHPRAVAAKAAESRVTLFPAAPAFLDFLIKSVKSRPLGSVRAAISVGTALATRIHADFTSAFGVPLWQSYGASEAGPVCLNKDGSGHGGTVDLGRPCAGVRVRIVAGDGTDAPEGEPGELVVESPAVGLGYEGETDAASRIEKGRFHTGDLAVSEGGVLRFAGRRKLLIAAAGHKVDPLEVETVLRGHPAVADAAVVAHREDALREVVKALVVTSGAVGVTELMEFCAASLSPWKVPRIFEFRAELPRNAMGKLIRERLDP